MVLPAFCAVKHGAVADERSLSSEFFSIDKGLFTPSGSGSESEKIKEKNRRTSKKIFSSEFARCKCALTQTISRSPQKGLLSLQWNQFMQFFKHPARFVF